MAAPSVLQIGVKQTVVVSVYKVNEDIPVTLRVEDKWENVLYQTPEQNVQKGVLPSAIALRRSFVGENRFVHGVVGDLTLSRVRRSHLVAVP